MNQEDEIGRFFPNAFSKRLDETHESQVRLNHTESLLRDFNQAREWLRDKGLNEGETHRRLRDQRSDLLHRINRVDAVKAGAELSTRVNIKRLPALNLLSTGVPYQFGCIASEGTVQVPVALEGSSVVPSGSASGAIETLHTTEPWEAPEPHYIGDLYDDSVAPFFFDLAYWLHNWRYVIPFPCVPCDGTLTYRVYFETGGIFSANALSASLSNWINVRGIPDVSAGLDFSTLPDYEVWPIDRNWPFIASFMFEPIWAGVTLEGSFAVKTGKAPVLALIVGVIVGVATGRFRILNAGFHPWEMQRFPPGGLASLSDVPFHAKVYYRFEP